MNLGIIFITLIDLIQFWAALSKELVPSPSGLTWDRHSLLIGGERLFIQSGEFHPWRLPVISQWTDILQKFAAAGLNTVSIYVHWGLVNPVNGTTDWTGIRSLEPFFDAARNAGLYVIIRPGPYINAETTAGGIPGWVTTLSCPLRTNSTQFEQSWKQYWDEMIDHIVLHQIGLPNGTIIAVQIENEYLTDAHSIQGQPLGKDGYMRDLADTLRDKGVVVPLTVNDAGMDRNYATGMGSGDIYGFDSYPQSFDCSNPIRWKPVVETYRRYQDSLDIDSPLFIPEFQAGAYDPWGATGYEDCRKLTGPQFESVFYLNNLAANIKLINYYMVYGGTNWGQLAFPGTYTSYDYGAALSEDRSLNEKYAELKRQSFFVRSSKDFYQTVVIGDSKNSPDYLSSEDSQRAFVTELRNPSSGSGFYIVRALNSSSTKPTKFSLKVLTSIGVKLLPQITLLPRESGLLVTDYQTSSKGWCHNDLAPMKILYTTSSVLLSACVGGHEVLYLFSNSDDKISSEIETGEVSSIKIPDFQEGYWTQNLAGNGKASTFHVKPELNSQGYKLIKWNIRDEFSIHAIGGKNSVVFLTSKRMAGQVWNPILVQPDSSQPPTSVLIWGPWLVRNASMSIDETKERRVLSIWGDFEEGVQRKVIIYVGGLNIDEVKWNGKKIENLFKLPQSSFLSFTYHPKSFKSDMERKNNSRLVDVGSRIDFRKLKWSYRDSLPELRKNFSDDRWVEATNEESANPYKKLYGKYYLYACDYGFCNGATIWHGHFRHNCQPPNQNQLPFGGELESKIGINLTIAGGDFFAASVWLNDVFLGSVPHSKSMLNSKLYRKALTGKFDFPKGSLNECEANTITVVQDSMGMDQTEDGFSDTVKHPRGILGYKFEGDGAEGYNQEITWKVQGHLGGFHKLPDPARGIYNENGFYAIRSGWHLPGYNERQTPDWQRKSPIDDGLTTAGIGFYHTVFELDFERGYDVMVSFQFKQPRAHQGRYRIEFWVNGWHMGKFISHLGPQMRFPVHEGILNYQGNNDFALVFWALDEQGAAIPGLELVVDKILEGGIGIISKQNPPYDPSRRQYF